MEQSSIVNNNASSGKTGLPDSDPKSVFPSDLVDPEVKKTKGYQLAYFKAAYNIHQRTGGLFNAGRRNDWIINKQYAVGNQNTQKYIKWMTKLKNAQNRPVSYLDLDWSIVSIIPKFRDVVLSYWERLDHTVMVDAINPTAAQERQRERARIEGEMILAPFFKEMSDKAGMDLSSQEDFMPETKEELDLYINTVFRLPSEALYQMAIEGVKFDSRWKEQMKQIRENFFDLGVAGTCVDIDVFAKKPYMRATDPINMVLMDFKGHDGGKMQRIGEIRKITIGRLKLEAGDQFKEEEYYQIAKSFKGYFNNPTELNPFSDYFNSDAQYAIYRDYDSWEIYVMDMDYDSVDRYKFEDNDKYGVTNTYRRPFDTPVGEKNEFREDGTMYTKKVKCKDIATVYTGKWIIGTQFIYDYGLLKNVSREILNPQQCYKRYKFYRVSTKSPLERALTFADSIQLTWLRLQNLKARAMPKGFLVEIGAFENVFLDGAKMTAKELLEIATQTGIFMFRRNSTMDDDGQDNAGPPITETKGGLGQEFTELTQSIVNDINMMREVTGINEIMASGAAPQADLLVGVQQQAFESANNAIWPMISAGMALEEITMKDVLLKIQFIVKHTGSFTTFIPVLGQVGVKNITIALEDSEPYIFNTRFVARPTKEIKQILLDAAKTALQSSQDPSKGGIEFPDYLEIVRLLDSDTDLKLVEMVLNQRIRKYKRKMQEEAQQNSKVQAEQLMAVEQKKAELELQKANLDVDAANKKYTHQINEDIRYLQAEHELKTANDIVNSDLTKSENRDKAALEKEK